MLTTHDQDIVIEGRPPRKVQWGVVHALFQENDAALANEVRAKGRGKMKKVGDDYAFIRAQQRVARWRDVSEDQKSGFHNWEFRISQRPRSKRYA